MRPVSPFLTYAGLVIVAAGFGVLVFSWSEVAARTNVALQMPYLLSGGLVGIGLILGGLTLVNINAKRQEGSRRDRQLLQLREVLADIRGLLAGEPDPHADDTNNDAAGPVGAVVEPSAGNSDDGKPNDDLTEPLPIANSGASSST